MNSKSSRAPARVGRNENHDSRNNKSGFQHQARKRFGQNFLHDQSVIHRIIQCVAPKPGEHLVEVGPGQGALTGALLDSGARLDAVELDRDLAGYLQQSLGNEERFSLHQMDVLKFDFSSLTSEERSLKVVGNLPYNISTPCLFHLLRYEHLISNMTFMLQLEVVKRLAAQRGDKNYGRLGLMVQYHCQVEHLFNVPASAFTPRPKVVSAIVRLTPHRQRPVTARDPRRLQEVIRVAFTQRRKTLRNSLKTLISEEALDDLAIDSSLRPENLSLAEYVMISDAITEA